MALGAVQHHGVDCKIQARFGFRLQIEKPAPPDAKLLSPDYWPRIQSLLGDHMTTPTQPLLTSNPELLGGTPVFQGTRVPAQTFIEYLEGGKTIDDFLEGFPTVTRAQVIAFLEEAKARMLTVAS